MKIMKGKRIIRIKSTNAARKHGNWYLNLVGKEFDVLMYSIIEAEYTVPFMDGFKILPDEDVEIVSDTETKLWK